MDFAAILAMLRDLVIVVSALVWTVAGVLAGLAALFVYRFVRTLPRRADGLIGSAHELIGQAQQAVGTAGDGARTAREAVGFISEKAVAPTITVVSGAAAVRGFVRTLLTGPTKRTEGTQD